jgi:hypothetical protein
MQAAAVAQVLSVTERHEGGIWKVLNSQARIITPIFGHFDKLSPLLCRYEQGLTHKRGEQTVSPLSSGSGREFDIKPHQRVIFLMAKMPNAGKGCRLLRIEPFENQAQINAFDRTRTSKR